VIWKNKLNFDRVQKLFDIIRRFYAKVNSIFQFPNFYIFPLFAVFNSHSKLLFSRKRNHKFRLKMEQYFSLLSLNWHFSFLKQNFTILWIMRDGEIVFFLIQHFMNSISQICADINSNQFNKKATLKQFSKT